MYALIPVLNYLRESDHKTQWSVLAVKYINFVWCFFEIFILEIKSSAFQSLWLSQDFYGERIVYGMDGVT